LIWFICRAHLSKGQWRALSPSQARKFPKTTVTSRIRFIPKVNSMRPITRLSGPRESLQLFQSGVRLLQNVLSVCVREAPGPMGSTVWGWQGIHRVLKEFGKCFIEWFLIGVMLDERLVSCQDEVLVKRWQEQLEEAWRLRLSTRNGLAQITGAECEERVVVSLHPGAWRVHEKRRRAAADGRDQTLSSAAYAPAQVQTHHS
ncbi:hypothetical protein cypCar_00027379, partial [Cyprinus carpio]